MVLTGYARKTALGVAISVAIGYILIIVGFGKEVGELNLRPDGSLRYSWWMVMVLTPVMLVAAVSHAILDRNKDVSAILGAITTFLGALFLTALGYLLNVYGLVVHASAILRADVHSSSALQFSGALIAGFSWVVLACLSHFYENEDDSH